MAEFFADIALCPLEATRIRLGSEPTFASGLISGFGKIARAEGIGAFYSGFGPILFKQVPYTMAKFVVYEKVSEAIYKQVDKNSISDGAKTGINLGSGLIAGFAAALVSQPADTMLSKINKTKGLPGEGTTSRLIKIARELGLRGSYTGIGARLFMVGTLVSLVLSSLQELLFDLLPCRLLVNLPFMETSSAFSAPPEASRLRLLSRCQAAPNVCSFRSLQGGLALGNVLSVGLHRELFLFKYQRAEGIFGRKKVCLACSLHRETRSVQEIHGTRALHQRAGSLGPVIQIDIKHRGNVTCTLDISYTVRDRSLYTHSGSSYVVVTYSSVVDSAFESRRAPAPHGK